jgi:ribose transport system substrate-binding protein
MMRWTLLALAMLMVVPVAGCRQQASGRKKLVIGMVAKSKSNDVFQAAHQGARDAAKELSQKTGVDIEVRIETPDKEDAQAQARAIRALASVKVAGIAVSCSDANTLRTAIDDAVDAGVPIVCFDSGAPGSKQMCYYGTNDVDCGKQVMQQLASIMGKKGNIAILAGNQSAPNLQRRVQGVKEQLKQYPDMKLLDTVYHEETAAQAKVAVTQAQTTTNPKIEGWAMIGGWPLFAENALPWEPGTVKVVAVDALPPQLSYLKSGHVQMLLAQNCYGWGQKSVQMLVDKALYGKEPPAKEIFDPLTPVTPAEAAAFEQKWKQWLGK